MRRPGHLIVLGAALLAASSMILPAAYGEASPAEPSWLVLVPSGRLGRFGLRVERTELAGSLEQVASRIARSWREEPWPMLRGGSAAAPTLSRLTATGIETVMLRPGIGGQIEARRSTLEWRDARNARLPEAPTPAFVAGLVALGEPLPGFASADAGASNLTRVWLSPGDIDTVARKVERIAAEHGLARLMRFDAPADAAAALRGGRVIAFGGAGVVAVATFNVHPGGVAVVVHCQERLP